MREFVPLDEEGLPETYDVEGLGGQPLVEITESENLIGLSYRFPGFFRSDRERDVGGRRLRFDVLDISGLGHVMSSGKPQLPSFGRYVQIPQGSRFEVSAESTGKTVKVEGVIVHPAQEMLTDGTTEHAFEYDADFYSKDEYYPKDLVTASGPFVVDGYLALLVHVCPLQYNPKRKLLRGHARIEVKIKLEKGVATDEPFPDPSESREAYGNLFLNPRRGVEPRVGFPAPRPIFPMTGPQLLIVHAPKFVAAAQTLARWKNRRGLITELLEFGGRINTAAALKAEIRRRRSALGSRLRYVLLLGDAGDIPCEVSALGNHTDYYYSTKDDYSAAVPLPTPWLGLGRIAARDAAEAGAVVNQIVAYEQTPPADPAYYTRFVCAGHFETTQGHDGRDYVFTMETIRAFLASLGHDAERVYTCDTSTRPLFYLNGQQVPADVEAAIMAPQAATQRLVDATTEGHVIVAHRDHGSTDGWYMPPFTLSHLDLVTGNVPSMFYSVNCLTGAWQNLGECFADKNLRLPGTAPTLVAATELTNTYLNNAMMLALFDATYGGLLPTFPGSTASYPVTFNRIGDILNYARSYLPLVTTSTTSVLRHDEQYHVLGDPSLGVWTREPRPLHIRARLTLRALEVELDPLPTACIVTIWLGSQMVRRLVPPSPRFTIPLPTRPTPLPIPREVAVCAWAPGFHYAETHVPIRVPVPVPVPVP